MTNCTRGPGPCAEGEFYAVFLFLFLFVLWLVLNGQITLEICLFGLVIAAAVLLFSVRILGYDPRKEGHFVRRIGWYLYYTLILVYEVVKASFHVMRIILQPHPHYEPAIVRIRVPFAQEVSRVFLANSITLTPGTVTIDQEGDDFVVLCLDKSGGDAIADWSLVKILRKAEEKNGTD